jgi:hypothetical protein
MWHLGLAVPHVDVAHERQHCDLLANDDLPIDLLFPVEEAHYGIGQCADGRQAAAAKPLPQ